MSGRLVSRVRVATAGVAVVVAVVLVVVLVVVLGGRSGRPDVVEHRELASAPKRLSDTGPPAGRFQQRWRTTVRAKATESRPLQVRRLGRHVVVTSAEGVDAVDARTGKRSWHYREPGRGLDGIAVTRGVLVASFDSAKDGSSVHTVGLDVDTGVLRWENGKEWSVVADHIGEPGAHDRYPDNPTGVVAVVPDGDAGRRLGIDARTGEQSWSIDEADLFEDGCRPKPPTRRTVGRAVVHLRSLGCTVRQRSADAPRADDQVGSTPPSTRGPASWCGARSPTPQTP